MKTTLHRRDVVNALLADRGDLLVIAGLGSTAWDITAAGDHDLSFPLWGAMGSAVMIGLGLALAKPKHRVLVVTSAQHMWRSLAVFRSLGLDAIPAGTDYGSNAVNYGSAVSWLPDAGALRGTTAALKEYLGIFVYWARGWIRSDVLFER